MRSLIKRWVGKHHRKFFNWFCETFYPLNEKFSDKEREYIEYCFDLSDWFAEKPEDSDYREFSYFTYSHRVRGEKVNSSRFAVGSLEHAEEAEKKALEVLEERQIALPDYFFTSENSAFYGLGWDFEEELFKVYFRIRDLVELPFSELLELLNRADFPHREEGLVSFTYRGGKKVEDKVYVYPKIEGDQVFTGTKSQAVMISSVRGAISQYDVDPFGVSFWKAKLNPTGQKIVETYAERGYTLDTIAIDDRDNFTLYFPGAFIPLMGTWKKLKKLLGK